MDKTKKIRVVVIMPVVIVLIVLGLVLGGVLIMGAVKAKPPTATAAAVSSPVHG
ncbi:MAG: hypothetical protein JWO78_1922 [Micavibrio sp.]|nr:hypothetical protein [Micavibrio sp.]